MIVAAVLMLASLQAPTDIPARADTVRRPGIVDTAFTTPVPTALPDSIPADTPTVRRRHAVSYSDEYYTRLTIHRYGSYIMLPLFAAEYSLGQNLINDANPSSWIKPAHTTVALGIAGLFAMNTITGGLNLLEAGTDPSGRTRRFLHTGLMLASDLGFVITAAQTPSEQSFDFGDVQRSRIRHRNWAIGSMALSAAGTAMMWFWKQ
jgi:hypothetical protein